MGDRSAIEWTDATWNPTIGCSLESPGCGRCYAMRQAARLARMGVRGYDGLTRPSSAGPVWTGVVRAAPDATIEQPFRWKRPRRVFVNSMSDLFHEDVPDRLISRVFTVMRGTSRHTYQVLTKRPDRMAAWLADYPWVHRHVWLGTSAEDQEHFDERSPAMAAIAAAGWNTWCSAEPLLGPIDVGAASWLQWLVVGGESGPGGRVMLPRWVEGLRQQCTARGIPFFFKQWGAWAPPPADEPGALVSYIDLMATEAASMRRVGKHLAGAELSGRTWQEWPA